MSAKTPVRVRIAPSPTGYFHIGSARTALFNWLFARQSGGSFIVRIEDTDKERSESRYDKDIFESLSWLGLDWDEGQDKGTYGPYRQSERTETYEKYLTTLLKDGHAYYCFCSKETLEKERQSQLAAGQAPKYSGRCRSFSADEVKQKQASRESSVIRFKSVDGKIEFTDLIRGQVVFEGSLMGDFVIAKDLNNPLYNFAVVVDDYEMKISHVIRGDDHLANTPKQILMQRALQLPEPRYGHLPLILDPDRSKMSKRFSATAISEYRREGYLPEAMVNFIAFLGWHPEGDKEIMTREELIAAFSLGRVQKAAAIFNSEKLDWLNGQYLKRLNDQEFLRRLRVAVPVPKFSDEQLLKVLASVRERMKKFSDWPNLTDFFWGLPEYEAGKLLWKQATKEAIKKNLEEASALLLTLTPENFTKAELEKALNPLAEARGRGEVFWPLRYAVSGKDASPGPIEIIEVLGKKETLRRIQVAIGKLA